MLYNYDGLKHTALFVVPFCPTRHRWSTPKSRRTSDLSRTCVFWWKRPQSTEEADFREYVFLSLSPPPLLLGALSISDPTLKNSSNMIALPSRSTFFRELLEVLHLAAGIKLLTVRLLLLSKWDFPSAIQNKNKLSGLGTVACFRKMALSFN